MIQGRRLVVALWLAARVAVRSQKPSPLNPAARNCRRAADERRGGFADVGHVRHYSCRTALGRRVGSASRPGGFPPTRQSRWGGAQGPGWLASAMAVSRCRSIWCTRREVPAQTRRKLVLGGERPVSAQVDRMAVSRDSDAAHHPRHTASSRPDTWTRHIPLSTSPGPTHSNCPTPWAIDGTGNSHPNSRQALVSSSRPCRQRPAAGAFSAHRNEGMRAEPPPPGCRPFAHVAVSTARSSSGSGRGSRTRKVQPWPGAVSRVRRPAWAVTRAWAMARPRPEPPVARVRESSVR